ncbi:GntR family transcriptional regulator [Terriglobus tenax]|uniref:GntR family transcriptional regulator n=1 Tax=Terriglobus tenax TaxID=1111115 RepID=UPI0021E0D35E|nr:GntR family transcriptional regulator [Terriglobus tenax]
MTERMSDIKTEKAETPKRSKYLSIVESLRRDIASGRYRPGARLPSEAELVRRFSVSRMTVVKAIQQLQQDGLLVRRAGSGTYAAGQAATEGLSFGLLIPDLGQTEIFEPICRGMMRSPSVKGHSLAWGHALSTAHKEEEAEHLCRSFIEQGVAGIFFAPVEFTSREDVNSRILRALDKAHIPVILLDRDVVPYPERSSYDLVGLDNRRAGYIVTDHLIRQGATRIAFFAREHSAETVDSRIAGYREALHTHDLSPAPDLLLRGEAGDKTFVEMALRKSKADAVMCANDHTAANLMQTILSLGLRIPEDIRIAGVDDVKYASLLPIPLTTFHQPCADIGAAGMSAMLERISNPHLPPRSIRLNGHLVVRRSCGRKENP